MLFNDRLTNKKTYLSTGRNLEHLEHYFCQSYLKIKTKYVINEYNYVQY